VITNKTGPEVRDYSSLSLTYGGIRAVEEGPPDGRVLRENLKVTRCQKCQKPSEHPFGTLAPRGVDCVAREGEEHDHGNPIGQGAFPQHRLS
jgi:hypothetical protein